MLCFKPTMFNDALNLVLSISHTMGTNMAWVKKSYIDQNCCSMMKSSVGHDNRYKKCSTTKNYGIQCYFLLGITLCNNFFTLDLIFLPTNIKHVVWTVHNINIF